MSKKLKRCVKSVKKKTGIWRAYSICIANLFKHTSYNKGHNHKWMAKRGYTTTVNGHKHKIKKTMALNAGKPKHTHRLLKKR